MVSLFNQPVKYGNFYGYYITNLVRAPHYTGGIRIVFCVRIDSLKITKIQSAAVIYTNKCTSWSECFRFEARECKVKVTLVQALR